MNGQLGSPELSESTTPAPVIGLVGIEHIACGDYHSLAIDENGVLWALGLDSFGQVGPQREGGNNNRSPAQPFAPADE